MSALAATARPAIAARRTCKLTSSVQRSGHVSNARFQTGHVPSCGMSFREICRAGAAENLGPTDVGAADEESVTTTQAQDASSTVSVDDIHAHRTHDHDDDHDDHSHDHDDSSESSSITTEHGSGLWRDFSLAVTGSWGGACVEFDPDGVAMDVPLRFVHGVGRVPSTNMPFRELTMDWMTKCDTIATEDGIAMRAKRAMPEIGNEDAISSCGGAEWGEHVQFVEDKWYVVLKGKNEDKTILPSGAFSAGVRVLPKDQGKESVVQHCLPDPSDSNKRVRVVHRVRWIEGSETSGESDSSNATWQTTRIEMWMEQRGLSGPECVAPFSTDERLNVNDLISGAKKFTYLPKQSAVYLLMWDDDDYETDAATSDTKTFFTMLEDAGEAEDLQYWEGEEGEEGDASTNTDSSIVSVPGLVRLPGNAWVFCGVAGANDVGVGAGGEEGQLVLECGWFPNGGSRRTVSARAYDFESGRLDSVSLTTETL